MSYEPSNNITIGKTTLMLFAGVILAVLIGGYLVFGSSNNPTPQPNPTISGASPDPIPAPVPGSVQEVYLKALPSGDYDKSQITVKKGFPVRLHFSTQGNVGCGRQLVIRGLNVQTVSNGAEQVVEFTPQNEGTYQYTCGMGMWGPGRLVVVS
ncbi:cupredoxin domain-containing protein [Candidatus Micrarchaeota archaeon]|nr:cupredoxin domain-containing protein [Candidatus Micrarchaeota archaeon]